MSMFVRAIYTTIHPEVYAHGANSAAAPARASGVAAGVAGAVDPAGSAARAVDIEGEDEPGPAAGAPEGPNSFTGSGRLRGGRVVVTAPPAGPALVAGVVVVADGSVPAATFSSGRGCACGRSAAAGGRAGRWWSASWSTAVLPPAITAALAATAAIF